MTETPDPQETDASHLDENTEPDTVTVAERIVRRGQLLHSPGEELEADYANSIGVAPDGTDAGEEHAEHYPGDIPNTAGSSWETANPPGGGAPAASSTAGTESPDGSSTSGAPAPSEAEGSHAS